MGLACSAADANPQPTSSFGTAVATLAATTSPTPKPLSLAPVRAASQPTSDASYPRLRRSYSRESMRLHDCASLQQDGSIVGQACPPRIIAVGPRVVAPTHSDVAVRFNVESPSAIEIASDIVSDQARRIHGKLEQQTLSPHERRTINYSVHVFEAAPAIEARIAVHGVAPLDFRITDLQIDVR
jgi:hypothetical protein